MDRDQQNGQRERALWPPTREQVLWTGGIVALLTGAILIGYRYDITLWDWIKLLIVPAVIAGGGLWFNTQQRAREQQTANARAQDEALQAYLDQMGQLLLDKDRSLRQSKERDEVRTLARARTLTVLEVLVDASRRSSVVRFLYEARLLAYRTRYEERVVSQAVVSLEYANLSGCALSGHRLPGIDLSNANLRAADLSEATLRGAHVAEADLSGADLSGAVLDGADLSRADLSGAKRVTNEELERQAKSLEGATMPNGQKYEDWLKSKESHGEDE